ncbi:negative regulation of SNARE complex assembly [Paramecium bursaria]
MSFELQEGMLLNTQFGYGKLVKVPVEAAPEPQVMEVVHPPPPPPLPPQKVESGDNEDPLPFAQVDQEADNENNRQIQKAPKNVHRLSPDLKESIQMAQKIEQTFKYPYQNDQRKIEIDCGGCKVFTEVRNTSNVVFILAKTFFGTRNYFLLIVPINASIDLIKQSIIEGMGQTESMMHNIKILHPIQGIKELNFQKLSDTIIRDYSQIIFIAQQSFTWDTTKKGKSIQLSNHNLTANKSGEADYQTVLGTLAIGSGRHYWEIKIDKYVDEEDIFIGIAKKDIDLYVQPTSSQQMFYGYICLCGRKFGADGQVQNYGYNSKQNDIIGVLLEFRNGLGTLSFYRNGVKCGEAFNNLQGVFYPALSMFYGEVQVTLDPRAPIPAC